MTEKFAEGGRWKFVAEVSLSHAVIRERIKDAEMAVNRTCKLSQPANTA